MFSTLVFTWDVIWLIVGVDVLFIWVIVSQVNLLVSFITIAYLQLDHPYPHTFTPPFVLPSHPHYPP
jgi:hypothetical protein